MTVQNLSPVPSPPPPSDVLFPLSQNRRVCESPSGPMKLPCGIRVFTSLMDKTPHTLTAQGCGSDHT